MIDLDCIYSYSRNILESESKISKYHYIGFCYNKNFKIFDIQGLSSLLEHNSINNLPQNLIEFVSSEKEVIFIPNIIAGKVSEIICRSTRNKRFINISCGLPSVFYNIGCLTESRRFTDPIIICEGTADCEYIKSNISRDVLACLTDSISLLKMEILHTLTNHVILSFDNDESGRNAEKREAYKLKRLGFFVEYLHPQPWFKDFGDMFLQS